MHRLSTATRPHRVVCLVSALRLSRAPRLAAILVFVTMSRVASAQTNLTWDVNGAAAGTGGTGTWDTATAVWFNGSAFVPWTNGLFDNAIFGGTTGTVTVSGPIDVHNLTFNTTGYTVSGGTLNLGGTTPTITSNAGISATISSVISGTAGLTKAGAGTLTLSGVNTFSGGINVNAGILSVTGNTRLGDASNGVTMAAGTQLTATGALAASRVVTLSGGTVSLSGIGVGAARFTGAGGISALSAITLSNNANDYTGQTVFTGAAGTYSFSSIADLGVASALGAPTTVANGTVLATANTGGTILAYAGTGGSSNRNFTLNQNTGGIVTLRNSGSGALTLNGNIVMGGTAGPSNIIFNASTGDLALLGVISQSASIRSAALSGSAGRTISLSGANTYGGGTQIIGVKVLAPVFANQGVASSFGILAGFNINNAFNINTGGILSYTGGASGSNRGFIFNNGTLSNDGSGALTLSGNMALTNTATLSGTFSGAANTASGVISGAGNLVVDTAGTWILTGTNTYTGTTSVNAGQLFVNGSQPSSPASINGGVLGGTGTVGNITASATGGGLAPGEGAGTGILNSGDVTLNSATTLSVALNGVTPGSGYDRLNVAGAVNLGGATLSLTVGFAVPPGSAFTLIDNDGTDPVVGTFAGLPEGSTVIVGGQVLSISYVGGTGNDLVLSPPVADVAITKSGPPSIVPGTSVVYTIVVTNNGPNGAASVVVTDSTPAGLTFVGNAGDCTTAFPCNLGTLANGATRTITATFSVPSDYTTPDPVVNTASVTTATVDPVPSNNSATTTTPVASQADLSITKTSSPNPFVPGEAFSYTIVVTNLGPSAAPGATVTDTMPLPATFGWTCTGTGGATCATASGSAPTINTQVDLPAGGSVTFLVTGTLPVGTTGALTNTATVTPPPAVQDPVLANNTARDANPAGPNADLQISKASTPDPYVPGDDLTYTIVVSNAGPSDAIGARVQDLLLPVFASFTWTCTAPPGAACGTSSGTGSIDALVDLPAGTAATFTVTGTVPSSYTGSATNTATVTPPPTVTDQVMGNNTTTTVNPPGPIADLSITKAQTPDPYTPGGALTYTLLVRNLGPSDSTHARVQDVVPGQLTNVAWTCAASGAGAACGAPSGVNVVDALVTLPAGTTATFTIAATVPPSATGVLINTATVTAPAGTTDPVPGTNTATVTSGPAPVADLAIVKTASANPYLPGGPLSFTIVVSNNGPSDAPNARVQDLFPAPLSGFTWTCAPSAGAATCGLASGISLIDVSVDLPVGGAVRFIASGTVPPDTTGPLTNTATVTSPVEIRDPDLANNLSAVTTGPGARADLGITKTSTPSPYVPGSPITYTVVATNQGPSAVFDGRVQDVVPPVLQNVTWTCNAVNGACPATSGTGSIDALVDIGVGGTVTFSITADVPVSTRGPLINTATIVPPPDYVDPTPTNNSGVDANPAAAPGGPVDLQITQEFPGVAPPNGVLTFRLRSRNLGANVALDPYMTGMIPPGTTFVSVTPSPGGTCNIPGNPPAPDPVTGYPIPGAATEPLRCTWPGLMKPGDSHYMEFTVRVAPGTPTGQILWSCWWTWSETEDPYHANNVVDAYLFVNDGLTPVGDLSVHAAALSEGVVGTTLPTRVGVPVPMRFWATNHGPAATRGQYALILDTANTIGIVEADLSQGWASPSGPSSAVWDTGVVQPGQTVTFDLTVRLLTPSAVELFAQRVTGSPGDPNASNERATIILDGYAPGAAGRWVAVGNVDGAGQGEVLTGAGQGETPQVRVFTGTGADTGLRFFAYERPFRGGVQIASCDVDGDGTAELITAPGPGRVSTIRVLSLVGGVVTELTAFDAFDAGFSGGASVACADLDADGKAEVIVGAGPGRAPEVQVYNVGLSSVVTRATFLAYESGFLGGVRVAAGVYPGRTGWLDAFAIATTPGPGRAAELRLWTPTGGPVAQVVVSTATRGVLPTLGDVNGDGQLDLLLAPDDGRPELVRIFEVDTGTLLGNVEGGLPMFPVGIRTAIGVLDGGPGQPEIVIGNGPGGHPRVRVVFWPASGPVQRLEILPLEIP